MESAHAWKQYYAAERDRMGPRRIRVLLDAATPLPGSPRAIVIPHTRLEITGSQIAAAVATVLASGAPRVLALGVLHGARRCDRSDVALARSGDATALARLRGVHDETGPAAEEFSLDAFAEMLELASGGSVEVVTRYPFLVGDDPRTLPGLAELERLVAEGALLVVTTDPLHHGHAYDTAPPACRDANDAATTAWARCAIDEQLAALSGHRFGDFAALTERYRSDFRDTGPVMAHLLGAGFRPVVHALDLVDYAEVLAAPRPSWVAGALVTI